MFSGEGIKPVVEERTFGGCTGQSTLAFLPLSKLLKSALGGAISNALRPPSGFFSWLELA